ncbi:MAG TPA: YbaB/EbfC family nucleoid-associated protein [Aggregatilineales bacterium]|nr:YbaB/EbfC family nucleoid-associated protein [Aggregatilineales bacterium]
MTKRRLGGGFGGPPPMGNAGMMKQLQKMQEDMAKAQAALEEETLDVQSGGGAITITITGHQRVKAVVIKPELLDTTDPEWASDLQDLLVVAINQAIEQSQQRAAERMEAITGNLGGMLPGGLAGML